MQTLKFLLATGRPVHVAALGPLLTPKLVELVGRSGAFDALWFDQEHAAITQSQIETAALAAEACGLDCFVRLPATGYASLMRPLEAGAGGVLVSMVRTLEDVREAIRWTRFHPLGTRGIFPLNREARFGATPLPAYLAEANERTMLGIQIETLEALEGVEAIASEPGVDLVFLGPVDLSQALGAPGDFESPRFVEAVDRVAEACRAAETPWGAFVPTSEIATAFRQRGCRLFAVAFDVQLIARGIEATRQLFDALESSGE